MQDILELPDKCFCGKKATKVFHKGNDFKEGDRVTFLCKNHYDELKKFGPINYIKKHGYLITYEITKDEATSLTK